MEDAHYIEPSVVNMVEVSEAYEKNAMMVVSLYFCILLLNFERSFQAKNIVEMFIIYKT